MYYPRAGTPAVPSASNKTGNTLVARSAPVNPSTAPQRTSPHCKMKGYSHYNGWYGNHSSTGWSNSYQTRQVTSSRSDKNLWWRHDSSSSKTKPRYSDQPSMDSSNNRGNPPANNKSYNNTTPSLTTDNNATKYNSGQSPITDTLSVDTNLSPVQQTGSPYSDTVRSNSSDYSYPVDDLVRHSNFSHHLHNNSYSDSVLPPYGQGTHYSCEPLHLVPRESPIIGTHLRDHTETLLTAHSEYSKSVSDDSSTNPELLDCDDLVNYNVVEDNNSNVDRCVEQDSCVVDSHNTEDSSDMSSHIEIESSCKDEDEKIVDVCDNATLTSDSLSATEDSTDIVFLNSCFPSISSEHIQQVYDSSDSILDRAVNTLLQLPTTPVKTSSGWLDICQLVDSLQEQSSHNVDEESSSASADHSLDVSADDEKIARALQEQFDREMVEHKSVSAEVVSENVESLVEPHPPDSSSTHTPAVQPVSDEGLILRLTPSLASTLQNMFGSVQKHLVNEGK